MPDKLPFFVFAFADHLGNLKFVKEEEAELTEWLFNIKGAHRHFDFVPVSNATKAKIARNLQLNKTQSPCWLHFSGHAKSFELAMQDGDYQSADALASLLKQYAVKVLFLNACSTKTLIPKIFSSTTIEAIVATNSPVDDKQAKEFSLEFYRQFIENKYSLEATFNQLKGIKYSDNCVTERIDRRDKQESELNTLDDSLDFAWGLFTRETEANTISIESLVHVDSGILSQFEREINELNKTLNLKIKMLDGLKADPESYEMIEEEIVDLKAKVAYRDSQIRGQRNNEKNRLEQQQQLHQIDKLDGAIFNLNYKAQRTDFVLGDDKIAGYAFLGDQESVMDFLYDLFLFHNSMEVPDVIRIDPTSVLYNTFWHKLSEELKFKLEGKAATGEEKKMMIEYVIEKKFFGGDKELPQRNILFRVNGGEDNIFIVQSFLEEFWQYVFEVLKEKGLDKLMHKWEKKMVFLFIDMIANEERIKLLKSAEGSLTDKFNRDTCFKVLDQVAAIQLDDLKNWLENNPVLSVAKLNKDDAEEIFKKSEGKMRRVLEEIVKKMPYEVPRLNRYIK